MPPPSILAPSEQLDFPHDVEPRNEEAFESGHLVEQILPLEEFLSIVQRDPEGIGSLKIASFETRRSRCWPFFHEYVVLTVYQHGIKWGLRMERFVFFSHPNHLRLI